MMLGNILFLIVIGVVVYMVMKGGGGCCSGHDHHGGHKEHEGHGDSGNMNDTGHALHHIEADSVSDVTETDPVCGMKIKDNRRGSVASGLSSLLAEPCSRLHSLVVRRGAPYDKGMAIRGDC